jgi:FtsH-binding integral membrane protein
MCGIIVLGIIIFFLIIKILLRYKPRFDLVISGNGFILLLWYNKYDGNNIKERVYIKLF